MLRTYNKNTDELLVIKTGELNQDNEVFFYHTALQKGLDLKKHTYMLDSLIISQLINEGVTIFYAVTSGFNMMEMDLISELKYKLISTSVILRKVYS